jgi:hypothetical protein
MNKKGNINQLFPAVLALVLAGILMGAGLMILSSFKTAADGAGLLTNASGTAVGNVITSLGTLATTWLPIIVVVLAAGIVLAILLGAFGGKQK